MADIFFSSVSNLTSSTVSDGFKNALINSVVGYLFSDTSSMSVSREFNSTSSIIISTNAPGLDLENRFISLSNIGITSISDINSTRIFNSQSDISISTVSEAIILNSFASEANITITIEDVESKYKIVGYEKLEYFTVPWTPEHIKHFYPKFQDLIRVFLRYLDYNSIYKTLTLSNNNDLNKIFPEFLDKYLDQYLNNTIDLTKYDLTPNNKQLFLMISRLLSNSKGTKKAFSYLFRSLTDIRIANEDINISVDKIITEFIESESWWTGGLIKYHDGVYIHDGSIDHSADFAKPFTYQFKIDQSRETMLPLIQKVHPAGFQQEFLIEMNYEDDVNVSDVLKTTSTYFHYFNYGGGQTDYLHDGTIDHSGSHQIIIDT